MSLVNFSALNIPPPVQSHYYQPPKINYQVPQGYQAGPYSYPTPQETGRTPFFGDYRNHQPPPPQQQPSQVNQQGQLPKQPPPPQQQAPLQGQQGSGGARNGGTGGGAGGGGGGGLPPANTPTFTRVSTTAARGGPNQKTRLHAVLDYDDDYGEYDDGNGQKDGAQHVTPIQGPIFLKNGTVPVVPLYSYPVLNNGTFVQIPVLWTALSVALGLELRGEIIRGVPCIKRNQQLFCPTAGNTYPLERIELFIDENKALMKRMYGDFTMSPDSGPRSGRKKKRETPTKTKPGVPDLHLDPGPDPLNSDSSGQSYFSKLRNSRQSFRNNQSSESGRVDACESKVEIVTPYWASNSAGKIRAIVNTQHFEQAIHQEVCSKVRTNRCSGDCGCEQKYKWHRLLAYDPDNDCKGIFMDWFLFPSCCVCRCNPP